MIYYAGVSDAGVAQLVEQLICNQQVVGSNPTAGSIEHESVIPFTIFAALSPIRSIMGICQVVRFF